ncbi:hypothetical protein A45J_0425 [hot springs metagenome]|uniref:Uncharacterized protein n=1 Tax=hot springs metagenome TaxID=433727 RepID=A0A5J4KXL6_9ZZZZ
MSLQEITRRLRELKSRGFIPALRGGSTGVGYTFEHRTPHNTGLKFAG